MTTQSYGTQLLWRRLDVEQPGFLQALLTRLAARTVTGEGEDVVSATYARNTGRPFAAAFNGYAVAVAADYADRIETSPGPLRATLAPLSARYLRIPDGRTRLTVTFPHGRGGAAAALVYRREGNPGDWARTWAVAPRLGGNGRRLTFRVTTGPETTAQLVLSNAGGGGVRYAVSAR
jgi:hypothetical protein